MTSSISSICYQGLKAKYEGLVSIKTFNKANRGKVYVQEHDDGSVQILYDYKPVRTIQKRNRNNPLYPYKNVVLCPHCRKPFLGSSPRGKLGGKFPTYHCNRRHAYVGIPKAKFDNDVRAFLGSLKFTTEFLAGFEEKMINVYRRRQKEVVAYSSQASRTVSDLKSEQAGLIDTLTKTQSEVVRRELEKKDRRPGATNRLRTDTAQRGGDYRNRY